MSLIERAIEKIKASGDAPARATEAERQVVRATAPRPHDGEGLELLEPLAPGTVGMQAAEGDPMRLAWDLRGNSALVSQLRNARREISGLLAAQPGRRRGTIILLTSALPGEGKSFCSLGLSRVLAAEPDRRVVLVDADLPKRRLSELLGANGRPGLVECLGNGRTVSEVLCRTDHPAMSFLPAGQWRSDAPSLLCGDRMDEILESFRQCDGRHVFVIDTAPVMALGETIHLAERADMAVVVVRANHTPRVAAEEAIRKLTAERPLAILLNGQRTSMLDGYYGYREYYGDYLPTGAK